MFGKLSSTHKILGLLKFDLLEFFRNPCPIAALLKTAEKC